MDIGWGLGVGALFCLLHLMIFKCSQFLSSLIIFLFTSPRSICPQPLSLWQDLMVFSEVEALSPEPVLAYGEEQGFGSQMGWGLAPRVAVGPLHMPLNLSVPVSSPVKGGHEEHLPGEAVVSVLHTARSWGTGLLPHAQAFFKGTYSFFPPL